MQRTTIIHFMRHGAVENPSNIRHGRMPGIHLSGEGRKQVEQRSLFFLKRPITHIFTSPLERTQQTATLLGLAFPTVPISLDTRLIETKTAPIYGGKIKNPPFVYPTQSSPDSETVNGIKNRISHFIEERVIEHNGKEIIAVSHADPIAVAYNQWLYGSNSTLRDFYPRYASVYSFIFTGLDLKEVWYLSDSD